MAGDLDARAKEVLGDALELPSADRPAFIRAACGGDAALQQRVEVLLAGAEEADRFLDIRSEGPGAHGEQTLALDGGEELHTRFGNYTLLERLGEGGFGMVYLAEQKHPVRRRVALKVIKLGMDTRAVIARFEQERQALAIMDHPNIAKVFDAGATETGRPYFVMELVRGVPITTYCDNHKLGIRERIELLMQVCRAVQHAHTKGVIHRDIKPANIIVAMHDEKAAGGGEQGGGAGGGGGAVCKVIDFGIAKAMQSPLTERTVFTQQNQLIGTPEYMSPEQASGSADIDTRTDVYSLGVLAYELLAGAPPFDPHSLRSAAYAEMQRIIREVDPPAPSTRLSQLRDQGLANIAARRGSEPARLGALLRGELDWIIMKAMEKERGRRYESPSHLAGDLHRYLTGDPVSAAPPGALYRTRKFVRRHRVGVIAGSLVAAAMVLGTVGTSIGLVNARRALERAVEAEQLAQARLVETEAARDDADQSSKIATAVTDFFTLDILRIEPGEPDLTLRQLLERVPAKIDQHFKADPAIEGAIRERVGQLYLNMGEANRASEFLEPAADLLEVGLGADHSATLMARQRLGRLMLDLDRYDRADIVFDQVYQSRMRILGPTHSFTLNSLTSRGLARILAGRTEQGLVDVNHSASEAVRLWGRESKPAVMFQRDRIQAYLYAALPAEAERIARAELAFLALHDELKGAAPDYHALLGSAILAQDRPAEALVELDTAWTSIGPSFPDIHPKVVSLRTRRGLALAALGRHAEALTELTAAYDAVAPIYGAQAGRCRELARALTDVAAQLGDEAGAQLWRSRS